MDLQNDPLLKHVPGIKGYKVLRPAVLYAKIGQGGMGAVYRGRHLNLEVDVAVKCLKASLAEEGSQFITRFQREAKIAAGIHHENLIHVYDVASEAGVHYLVMEYISGETVRQRVKRKGPLAEHEAETILLGAARGLAVAHKKRIVHRDIKPDNILISREGAVKVADLGIARAVGNDDYVTLTHGSLGTPQYMPPEQWLDASKVATTADVWALGATLYFMLVGENAITATSQGECALRICNHDFPDISARRAGLDPRLLAMLKRMTERDPARRHANGAEVARELELLLGATAVDLADDGAGGSRVHTLVSPPPAQTLAEIRIEIGTGADRSLPTESYSPAPTPPPVATPPAPAAPARARGTRGWIVAGGILTLVLGGAALKFFVFGQRSEAPGSLQPRGADPGPAPVVPPTVIPSPPRIALADADLAAGRYVLTRELAYELRGKLENAAGAPLTVTLAGKPPMIVSTDADGSFLANLALVARDARNSVKLSCGTAPALELTIEHDGLAPKLEILVPAPEKRATAEKSIDVEVSVADEHLESVRIGSATAVLGAGRWKANGVPLPREGANPIPIEARDAAGNVAKLESLVIERDTTAPGVVRWSPDDRAFQPDTQVEVRLECDEAVEELGYAGKTSSPRTKDALIQMRVPKSPGPFQVQVELADLLGNRATATHEFRAGPKRRLPVIQLEGPLPTKKEPLVLATPSFVLKGRVVDPGDGVLYVSVGGGKPAEYALEDDGSFDRKLGLNGNERNDIRITHADASPLEFSVTHDSLAPRLELVQPAPDALRTRESSLDVVVAVEEANLASLELDGRALQPVPGGRWASRVALSEDRVHSFQVVARDAAGLSDELVFSVERDTTGPRVTEVDPEEGREFVPGSTLELRLVFSEIVRTLTIDGVAQTLEREEARVALKVPEGQGAFTPALVLTDRLGNATTVKLTYARTPPAVAPASAPEPVALTARSLPEGWSVEDETPSDRGWPKKVRHAATGIVFLLVPHGTFKQGFDPRAEGKGVKETDERPQHEVTIEAPFYMAENEVTVGQWRAFAAAKPYQSEAEKAGGGRVWDREVSWPQVRGAIWSAPIPGLEVSDQHPVTQVSWVDAQAFCDHYGLALPSESQWEYACRAGTVTRFWWGKSEKDVRGNGNIADDSLGRYTKRVTPGIVDGQAFTARVGSFAANRWGLRDMLGNVWEWCSDPFDADLYSRRGSDPAAAPRPSNERVLRGGCWQTNGTDCRSARRSHAPASGSASDTYGFRVAWMPPQ